MELLQNWIETLGVAVTALATIALAWVTTVLARETKRLAESNQRPQVVVTIEPSKRSMIWLDLHIENTGTAPAFDVELDFEPPLELERHYVPLKHVPVIKPRQVISSSFTNYSSLKDKRFSVIAKWALAPGGKKQESLSYIFDAKFMDGMSRLGAIPEVELANSVKKLSEDFAQIAMGFRKLAINVYTSADREAEEKEREEWLQRQVTEDEPTSTEAPPST